MLKWQMEVAQTNPDIHTSSTSSDTLLSRLRLSLYRCSYVRRGIWLVVNVGSAIGRSFGL